MADSKNGTTDGSQVHERMEDHSKLFRDLLLGFVKVHVLYHANREPIYGVGITTELDKHGYRLSPGTLYPLLHSLEAATFVEREDRIVQGKVRKYYRTTPVGRRALAEAREKILELVDEIMDADLEVDDADRARGEGSKRAPAKRARRRAGSTTRRT